MTESPLYGVYLITVAKSYAEFETSQPPTQRSQVQSTVCGKWELLATEITKMLGCNIAFIHIT